MIEVVTAFGEEIKADEIGPERVIYFWDPEIKVKGVLVIDNLALGMAGGGIRMLPDISTAEMCGLARAMTLKWATGDIYRGGAKAGIWADPQIQGPEREKIFRSYGRFVRPLYQANIVRNGSDMGTTSEDCRIIWEECGVPLPTEAYEGVRIHGELFEDFCTGAGVVAAAVKACEFSGLNVAGASVALEGFGKVGRGAIYSLLEHKMKVVALSTIHGAIYNEKGLDIEELFKLQKDFGDEVVLKYEQAEHLNKEDLYFLPVDVLIPGARPYVITEENADKVRAKIVSSAANIPITEKAAELLFKKQVTVVPDFVSNSGGMLMWYCARAQLEPKKALDTIKRAVGKKSLETLQGASKEGILPSAYAANQALIKIRKARAGNEAVSPEETLNRFKEMISKT